MAAEKPFNPDDYPSIDLAYEVSLRTYDWAISRLQDVERRIDNLLRLGLTGTIALPIIAQAITKESKDLIEYATWPVGVAFVLFVLALSLGVLARRHGRITLINPKLLYDKQISKEPWDFKRQIIYFAGKTHITNAKLIESKSTCADIVAVLFGVELVFGAIWILGI